MADPKAEIPEGKEKEKKSKAKKGDAKDAASKKEKAPLDPAKAKELAEVKANKERRALFEDLMTRKFFYVPSFEIYGSVGGLYDYGPPGTAVLANLVALWRQHFVLAENMLEVSCSCMSPDIVLRTSGHVDRFTDFMVRDTKTNECHRADKLLEDWVDKLVLDPKKKLTEERRLKLLEYKANADAYSGAELGQILKELDVRAPETGNTLTDPFPFNLMFSTQIGPTGKLVGYLRPETAQGIFTNFRRLLEYNAGQMPFAAAQVGLGFRNEISPRSGLLRVREFMMGEIEHFVHPDKKAHPRFVRVANVVLSLLGQAAQDGNTDPVSVTIGEAVATGLVNNETLGYFMARTQLFFLKVGIPAHKIRFRQHKATEMAHYAADCWDAEILTTYGWIECAGHADRSAYDLSVHAAMSKVDLYAQETLPEPRIEERVFILPNREIMGPTFRKASKPLYDHLAGLSKAEVLRIKGVLAETKKVEVVIEEGKFELTDAMIKVVEQEEKVNVDKYIPNVIEPSFGMGRIIYALLEESFYHRDGDVERQVLRLPGVIAPIKVGVFPLSTSDELQPFVETLVSAFIGANLTNRADTSGVSIGKKYARADELGIPYGITIDFDTVKDQTVTLRDRDSTTQVRVAMDTAVVLVSNLINGLQTWEQVYATHPQFFRPEAEEK